MKLSRRLNSKFFELGLGFLTWGFICFFTLHFWQLNDPNIQHRLPPTPGTIVLVCSLLLLFLAGYLWRMLRNELIWLGPLVQSLCLLSLMWLFPNGMILILGIMLVAHLSELFKPLICVLICLLLPLLNFLLSPAEYGLVNAMLFSTLNLFALFIATRLQAERQAKEANAHLLRELRATQSLLYTTTRRDERLRIARDLHDVLGHHLTALSIQLEVANQLSQDNASQPIKRAQELAKLLLADVREAVADIRRANQLDIQSALQALIQDLDGLNIILDVAEDVVITDARAAEALFRCAQEALTNVLKHARATQCRLHLYKRQEILYLQIEDNGRHTRQVVPGHGLTGMQERLNKLDGELKITADAAGFRLLVSLPDSAA
ncbi:sensor histidine kinase [Bowmanella pacifica]|uniref:Signal transduction histidine kinase subgroup 3 dimerisation and phosphoacceptor domain-containing protein n=1 Tax=Bowmanella pacifica TaxID=502051 RepID=A0A917YSI3_9ALTE|nr:histidine kinase [Bowmanella pacifica]GGO65487.1 hypothetical protein GCM10010982_07410 [Bowmanella pacifica]